RRRHTRLQGDWSSDVCSSDLNDDVAVEDSLYTAGRRGTGVTVLVEKIAGAKAEAGGSLAEVAAIARKVNERGRSFGVALTSCARSEERRVGKEGRHRWARGRE